MDSPVIETAVGLVFVFAVFAAFVATATEAISRFIGLRGEYLLRGLRSLLDGTGDFELGWIKDLVRRKHVGPDDPEGPKPMVTQVMEHPMVASTGTPGVTVEDPGNAKLTRKERLALPSYVSGRVFAGAVVGILVPDASGTTTLDQVRAGINQLEGQQRLKERLLFLVNQADGDLTRFRTALEQWYDDHMARVSGWYKRHVRGISFGLALVFAILFNLNAIEIGRTLYSDDAVRAQVVAQAEKSTPCTEGEGADCVAAIRQAASAGIPIGWTTVDGCALETADCDFFEERGIVHVGDEGGEKALTIALLLLGLALMAATTVPGARFWFDSLSRLGSLRSTGPKPETSTGT
jgi:hypothetical protein